MILGNNNAHNAVRPRSVWGKVHPGNNRTTFLGGPSPLMCGPDTLAYRPPKKAKCPEASGH